MNNDRLLGLDMVRGLCAVAVMIYHYLHVTKIGTYYAAGTYGVYIFFVLSGFALYYKYGQDEITESGLRNFYLARAFRIIPLYAAVVGYQFLIGSWGLNSATELLLNSTLMFGLTDPGITSGTPGGWSIGVEAVFYLMFPLILLFRSTRAMVGLLLLALVLNHLYVNMVYETAKGSWARYIQPVTFLCFFVGGMLLGKIAPHLRFSIRREALGAGSIIVLLTAMFVVPHLIGINREDLLSDGEAKIMIALSFSVVALGAVVSLSGALKRIAVFLGDISYALYLIHLLVFSALTTHLGLENAHVQIALSAAVSVILAKLIYNLFEKPMRGLQFRLRSGGNRMAPTPASL